MCEATLSLIDCSYGMASGLLSRSLPAAVAGGPALCRSRRRRANVLRCSRGPAPARAAASSGEDEGSSSASDRGSAMIPRATTENGGLPFVLPDENTQRENVQSFLYPNPEELPDEVSMTIWDHLEELRSRVLVSAGAVGALILLAFCFSKDLVLLLESPVAGAGVRFIASAPGEYFFTTIKVAGYSGLLLGAPIVLYEIVAFVVPGLTRSEKQFLAPIVLGSSVLFYGGIFFSYEILTPAALNFFVSYNEAAVESLWSIDQYFEFVLVLMLSTGLAFQVPVIQMLLGGTGLVSATQMFSIWKYVVVGATLAAAVLTPSTDPFTQGLLALPLIGLYFGGACVVAFTEKAQGRGPWADGAKQIGDDS